MKTKRWHATILGACVFVVGLLVACLIYQMTRISILPVTYSVAGILLILIIFSIGILLQFRKKIILKVLGIGLIVISFASCAEGIYLYENSIKALSTIANQDVETTTYGVYVLESTKVSSTNDLQGKMVGVSTDMLHEELPEA